MPMILPNRGRLALLTALLVVAACARVPAVLAQDLAQSLAPGTIFKDCATCPELVVVPEGRFVMGSNGRYETESPAHLVDIKQPFAIGRYEVTFDQWQMCVTDGGCTTEPDDHTWGRGARPVMNVTWFEAAEYAAWISRRSGRAYRLPTEAEWEYAARAGTRTEYAWGDEATGKALANCRDCGAEISHQTEPVGSFPPNPWGLYDMHGNVWEWTADCWVPNYEAAPADGSARQVPAGGKCAERVMRSGSWYYFSKNLRSRWRAKNDPRVRSYGIGFRLVRELD